MSEEPKPWLPKTGEQDGRPLDPGEAQGKLHAPATLRNRADIVQVLNDWLPPSGRVLEIASGSGEHIVYFASSFPQLRWQPSDPEPVAQRSIAAWTGEARLGNVEPPIALDAAADDWKTGPVDAILCINMVHISPWEAAHGLFAGAGRLLMPGTPLILYGPFIEADVPTADSNRSFDASLKSRDPRWGLRDVADIAALAQRRGFARPERRAMPANNLILRFVRQD